MTKIMHGNGSAEALYTHDHCLKCPPLFESHPLAAFPQKTAEWVPLNILWIIPQTTDSVDSELEGENNIL